MSCSKVIGYIYNSTYLREWRTATVERHATSPIGGEGRKRAISKTKVTYLQLVKCAFLVSKIGICTVRYLVTGDEGRGSSILKPL